MRPTTTDRSRRTGVGRRYRGGMTDVRSIYVTAADLDGAQELADALLQRRLIACANLLPGMRSLYRWRGDTASDEEVAMVLKTTAAVQDEVLRTIEELHPYEVPCAVVWPVEAGIDAYLDWVREETAPAAAEDGESGP